MVKTKLKNSLKPFFLNPDGFLHRLLMGLASLILVTFLLQPFRYGVSQDDGAYAAQAVEFSKGNFNLHPDVTAALLPQTLFGAGVLAIMSGQEPTKVLNALTWIVFCLFALWVLIRKHFSIPLFLAVFSVPFWFQYGASFLYDTYEIILIWMLLIHQSSSSLKSKLLNAFIPFILSIFIVVQVQTLALIPLGLAVRQWLQKQRSQSFLILGGVLVGIVIYWIVPKSVSQTALPAWIVEHHQTPLEMLSYFVQLMLGLGVFLLPFISFCDLQFSKRMAVTMGGFLLSVVILTKSDLNVLAAGVLFTPYLPKVLGSLLISVGFFGWFGVLHLFNRSQLQSFLPVIGSYLILFLIYSWRGVVDVRYCMVAMPLLFFLIEPNQFCWPNGKRSRYLSFIMCAVSIFLNKYSLDTTEARWLAADQLLKKGVDPREVSAGYGRDLYSLESSCVRNEILKNHWSDFTSKRYLDEIYSYNPRLYSKGWIPKFVIKPSMIFGKKLSLKLNTLPGQSNDPIETISYTTFGVKCTLAVTQNQVSKFADCF